MTEPAGPSGVDISAVIAARAGDRSALDALVAEYLPLVYSIVGRTLSSDADVDDVVQETMVRLVRGIGGLREPGRFRSWLVAVAINQIREHRGRRHTVAARMEPYHERPDPNAEFVDQTLTGLSVSAQVREIGHAARWLHSEDRELLSLWSLERGGNLTRADLAHALGLDAHHVTVRVSRLKERLEAARVLVRALAEVQRCRGLAKAASQWTGEPTPLWRKRFQRHVDSCQRCRGTGADLVPVERLLMGLALMPLPAGYALRLLAEMHSAAHPVAKSFGVRHRIVDFIAAKPALAVAGTAAACAVGLAAVVVPDLLPTTPAAQFATPSTVPLPDKAIGAASLPSTVASTSPPATTTPSAQPSTKAAPARPQPTPSRPPTSAARSASGRLLALLNERRRGLGLPEVKENPKLVEAARACAEQNMRQGGLTHCGHEVLYRSSGTGTPPEQIMNAWFNSLGHKTALTYASSRNAGAAVVIVPNQGLVAALNIDY